MREHKYREEWLRLRTRYERIGRRVFRGALQRVANRVPWDQADDFTYRMLIENNIDEQSILQAYQEFYVSIGLMHGKRTGKAINKYKKPKVKEFDPITFEQVFPSDVLQWLRSNAGSNIVSVRSGLVRYLLEFIEAGMAEGLGVQEMATRIQTHILSQGFYRWQISRIVRTETTAAANYGAYRSGTSSDLVMVKTWISATDARTRRIARGARFDHFEMNLKEANEDEKFEVPGLYGPDLLDFPGDPKGQPGNIINCYLPDTVIESNILAGQRSFYSGVVVEIVTIRGKRLAITPNHGIFTEDGFIPANQIKVGMNLVCNGKKFDGVLGLIYNYIQKKLFSAQNIFGSLENLWASKQVVVTGLDFDTDGKFMNGNIDIVYPKRRLANGIMSQFFKQFNNLKLKATSLKSINVCGFSPFNLFRSRNNTPPARIMSLLHLSFPLLFRHFTPLDCLSLGRSPNFNSQRHKPSGQSDSTDSAFLRELIHTNPGLISFDKVVDVRYRQFSGHVYDFTSYNGVNIANNIYTSNCRCSMAMVPKLDENGDFIERTSAPLFSMSL